MEHDAWFFVGVFLFIFLVWIATGGPAHPLSFSGPTLALPGALGGGTYLTLPRAPFSIAGDAGGSSSGGSTGSSYGGGTTASTPVGGVAFGTPSPYRGQIRLTHYVSGAEGNAGSEYVQIFLSHNAPGPVTITGWYLKSEATNRAAQVPLGTQVPSSGNVNPVAPIVLQPGDEAVLISGRSPVGVSFRENKCIGYLETFQDFSPQLPNTCPLPKTEMQAYYSNYIQDTKCIDYVNTLRRCNIVISTPRDLSTACREFAAIYLNYNSCVVVHGKDTDFAGHTWRVYLGRTFSLWRESHEVVKLLDSDGKTVDAFTY